MKRVNEGGYVGVTFKDKCSESAESRLTMRELGTRWDVAVGTGKVSLMGGFILMLFATKTVNVKSTR
jgi:hypothetical protein